MKKRKANKFESKKEKKAIWRRNFKAKKTFDGLIKLTH